MNKIRIIIADDHEIVRLGLVLVLSQEADFEIIGEAEDGKEALSKTRQLKPDILLLDWKMPKMNGFKVAKALRKKMPQIRILVLSGAPIAAPVLDRLDLGIDGFVHKDISSDELAFAIRKVASGERYLSAEITQALRERAELGDEKRVSLTRREMDVLRLMVTPGTYRQIGEQLFIGEETVRTHAKNIMRKLKQPNRTQTVIVALRSGLID